MENMKLNQAGAGYCANSSKSCARVMGKSFFLASTLLGAVVSWATPPPAGVAPLIAPAGGFAIDGDLQANSPDANIGDWLVSTNTGFGGGSGVLDLSGAPIV